MKTTFTAFSESMKIITLLPGRTRDEVNTFLYPGQLVTQPDRFVDEISWEVSSTIITGSLPLRFLAMDRIFAPYRFLYFLSCMVIRMHFISGLSFEINHSLSFPMRVFTDKFLAGSLRFRSWSSAASLSRIFSSTERLVNHSLAFSSSS